MSVRADRLYRLLRRAGVCVMFAAVLAVAAVAQDNETPEKSSSIFDTVSRWLTVVGERTEDLLAPRFGRVGEAGKSVWAGLTARSREFEESREVRAGTTVFVKRTIGEGLVRISTWDNPVVRVKVSAVVGAEQAEIAEQLVEALDVDLVPDSDRIDIAATAPNTRDRGKVAIKLDYDVTVPSTSPVFCTNEWGDTEIANVAGVTLDSKFGAIDLRALSGPVKVRAWGEFPLRANDLRQGGTFQLQGTQAEFANIAGELKVSNFMGTVTLRELAAETSTDITCDSGPIHVVVPENATPSISASVAFGAVESDIKLEQTTAGDLVRARGGNLESKQQLSLHASFDTITIRQEGVKPPEALPERNGGGELVRKNIEQVLETPQGAAVVIKAIAGDVRVTASDSNQLVLKAAQVVQMRTNANAQAAIEALHVRGEVVDGRVLITTAVRDNMAALGCTHYRIDLELSVPKGSPISMTTESGFSTITGAGAAVRVEQGKGSVVVERCTRETGEMDIALQEGEVVVTDCGGPLNVSMQQGTVKTAGVSGKQVITLMQGRALVESPKGELVLRNNGGDANVLALDGVLGPYDIHVEKGTIDIVVPKSADATLWATAKNGQINSSVRLTGSIEGDTREFTGPLGNGRHRVNLETVGGDIFIVAG